MSTNHSWFSRVFCCSCCSCCCCAPTAVPIKRTITLGCFGIDGAGKTTLLKLLKGEDPRNVLTTNGFSVLEMEYSEQFHLRIYDVGGDRGIRDIWSNYYAELYGIIFVLDYENQAKFDESVEAMHVLTQHPHCAKKPILFVINNKNNQEIDDVEISNMVGEKATTNTQQQMVMITHINRYNGYLDNIKKPTMNVLTRARKDKHAFQDQFVAFIDLITEHFVYLSEGVRSAEIALKIKQQAEKDKRRINQMREEHDVRRAEVAALEGRRPTLPANETAEENKETDSPPLSLASSTIPSDIVHGSPEASPDRDPLNLCRVSQTSTKPATPEESSQQMTEIKEDDNYFLPLKPPGRHVSRIQRIQNVLSNRVVPK